MVSHSAEILAGVCFLAAVAASAGAWLAWDSVVETCHQNVDS